jgi:hypothetical protein
MLMCCANVQNLSVPNHSIHQRGAVHHARAIATRVVVRGESRG